MFYECIFTIYWFPKLSASYYIVSQYVTDQKASKLIKCGRCRAAGYAIFYFPCTFNFVSFYCIIIFSSHIIYILLYFFHFLQYLPVMQFSIFRVLSTLYHIYFSILLYLYVAAVRFSI